MPLTPEQTRFIGKYLSARVTGSENDTPAGEQIDSVDLMAIWRTAKESTDAGISALQAALKSVGHPELDGIADAGLNGIADGNQTAMIRAIMDYNAASIEKKDAAAGKLLAAIDSYRGFLESSKLIPLAENNPFGIKVSIRKPLSAALTKIAKAAA